MSVLSKLVGGIFRGNGDSAADDPDSASEAQLRRAAEAAGKGRLNDAREMYDAFLRANPRSVAAWIGLGGVLCDLWAVDEAVLAYERARELAPRSSAVSSAVLFHRHYMTPFDADRMAQLHRSFGAMMAQSTRGMGHAVREPSARLRIGYVSPNLSRHSVGYFIAPVIRCHDREHFEVYCYYNHKLSDDATRAMRDMADGWREIASVDDDAMLRMVREDGIDILVDLAGHSKGNRLAVFARKPAPLQMTWLGYPDTTGLASIDYRITDQTADPAPGADHWHSESLARIEGCFLCYEPPGDAPAVKARPADVPVVFGSFNHIAKLNGPAIALWQKVLAALPGSRLILKSAPFDYPDTVDRVLDAFEGAGVDVARVELRGWANRRVQHLDSYGDVDIALDTFPYNGTTTTCEALWMGVPVVTLCGEVHMSRVGASILHSVGLDSLIAHDEAQYLNIAIELAQDDVRRRTLRNQLRERLLASSLLDHAGFTHKLENVYRTAWRGSHAVR